MSEHLYLLTLCLPLGTVLLVFGMRYLAATQQAKARHASDESYRQMAEKALAVQADTAATLSSMQTALADMRARLAAVEKVLKEVE